VRLFLLSLLRLGLHFLAFFLHCVPLPVSLELDSRTLCDEILSHAESALGPTRLAGLAIVRVLGHRSDHLVLLAFELFFLDLDTGLRL
jgi:hypothetical protein